MDATPEAASTEMAPPGRRLPPSSSLCVVIPLRQGSQGCPRKQLRPFRGATLLEHAVTDALALNPTQVIVTTNYPMTDIPLMARPYYQERPPHLCQPDSPMSLVLKHVAQPMHAQDVILLMQPNCYHPERVRLAKRVLSERVAGTSVRYPDFWHPAYAIGGRMPKTRQGLEPAYRPDGLLYRVPVSHLILLDPFMGDYIPVVGTVNVDTEADWKDLMSRYG